MRFKSLRSKIFLFIVLLLVAGASLIMVFTQHNVTRTVTTTEERAVDNILHLVARDSVARWGALLNEKTSMARQARQPLIQFGALIASVLDTFHQQQISGLLDPDDARQRALEWVGSLQFGTQRHALILDRRLTVLGDSRQLHTGQSLAQLEDIKGRRFADIAQQELGTGTHSFIIYRQQADASEAGSTELRYATFAHYPAWDWIIAISDSAQPMLDQFEQQRVNMEAAVAETIRSIQLAGSGFVFIVDHDGRAVTPVPPQRAHLLQAHNTQHNLPLIQRLAQADAATGSAQFSLHLPSSDNAAADRWIVKTAYVKPLSWTVVAAVPAAELARPAMQLRNHIGMLFAAGLLAALAVAWLLSARITGPLQQLGDFARRLPERNLTLSEPLPAHISTLPKKHHDEVGGLAAAIIHMDAQLREKVQSLLDETSRRQRFESELNIARDIQMGPLPVALADTVLEHIDLHATMLPAKEVGGDLYDYFLLPDGRLCFAIGDVSDKGVPAALFMAVTRTLIRACAEELNDPASIMERVNTRLSTNNPNMMFVTLIIGVLDLHDGHLLWANAGHPPPSVVGPDGRLRVLEGRSGPACGVQPNLPYRGFSTQLLPGEIMFSFTDGIPEAMNPQQEQYGEDAMYAQLNGVDTATKSSREVADAMVEHVREFAQGSEQSDDITLLIIKRLTP